MRPPRMWFRAWPEVPSKEWGKWPFHLMYSEAKHVFAVKRGQEPWKITA